PQPAPSTTQPIIEEQIPVTESSSPQNTQIPRQALQEDTRLPQTSVPIPNVADKAVFKEWDDRVVRDTTTAASLDAAQASGDRPRCQESMGGVIDQTRSERASKHSYDSPLPRVNTPGRGHTPESDEGRLQQEKLTDIVTALSQKDELKFQKSKSKRRRLTFVTSEDEEDLVVEDPSKQGRSLIEEMDLDAGISLVSLHVEVQGRYRQNLETQEGFGEDQDSKVFGSILNTEGLIQKLDDLKVNHKCRGGLLRIRGFYNLML
ncbi:hypothetical protein Tco_1461714, partial [Tanacetum coccineum]